MKCTGRISLFTTLLQLVADYGRLPQFMLPFCSVFLVTLVRFSPF